MSILGLSWDGQISWKFRILEIDGQITVHPDIMHKRPSHLKIYEYLNKGGHMTVHPAIIPGWLMNPGILGQWGDGWSM